MKYKRMHIKRLCVAILIVPLFFIAELALADTEVGGNITEDTTWTQANSPYIVTSTVQVFEETKLTIEPGVTIKFNQDTGLTIGGELYAVGTEDEMIIFTSNQAEPAPNDWDNISFITSAVDSIFDSNYNYIAGSILKYCIIEYSSGCINLDNTNLYIGYNILRYNYNGAIRENGSNSLIIGNNIYENSNNGGNVFLAGDNTVIRNNIINNRGTGIYIACGNIIITNNTIEENGDFLFGESWDGTAIEIYRSNSVLIKNNIIRNNKANNGVRAIVLCSDAKGVILKCNNIFDNNVLYELAYLGKNEDLQCMYNYWGTTAISTIDEKIFDYFDDIKYKKVIYEPIAFQPYDFSGSCVSGNVANSSTGQPIIGAVVSTNIGVQTTTNNSGEYLFENFSPGDYTLTVTALLYHSSTVENVTVTAGETTTQDISLDPKTTGTVAGQVVSAEGLTAIENVTVQISNGTDSFTVNSDVDGNFTFDDITYGDYTIDLISDSYRGIPYSVTVNVDEITQVSLVGIPQSIVDDIRSGWFTQDQLNQAVADAEAAKDVIIASKDQTISELNTTIASMYTQDQLNQAVTSAEAVKEVIIAQKDQTITDLNSTIVAMFTQEQLNQAVADAETAKDVIIASKDQAISGLNTTIASMYTQEQLNQAVSDAETAKNAIIAEKNQTITDLNSNIASMFSQEQIDQAVINERQRWDINGDNKISLEEAIHALQVVSGIR
ncbi:MAG: DUF2012 domain-containing protein [Thermodesulfobacteriota bacterium]|nr:DUF2012 domain-containing protein [Thermodesulfobacteriota bacterium]